MLPVGVGKNKNSRGRKKNGHHGHYFGGLVGKYFFSTKIPNIIRYFTVKYIAAPSKWLQKATHAHKGNTASSRQARSAPVVLVGH